MLSTYNSSRATRAYSIVHDKIDVIVGFTEFLDLFCYYFIIKCSTTTISYNFHTKKKILCWEKAQFESNRIKINKITIYTAFRFLIQSIYGHNMPIFARLLNFQGSLVL